MKTERMEGHFVTRADACAWIDYMMGLEWKLHYFYYKGPVEDHPFHVQLEKFHETK